MWGSFVWDAPWLRKAAFDEQGLVASALRSRSAHALLLPCRALAAAEARLAAAATRVQEHEAAAAAQRGELEALAQHVAGVEAEYGALREEYRAVTDDLAALVRENQVGAGMAS